MSDLEVFLIGVIGGSVLYNVIAIVFSIYKQRKEHAELCEAMRKHDKERCEHRERIMMMRTTNVSK